MVVALLAVLAAGCTRPWSRADLRSDLDVVRADRSAPAASPFGSDEPGILHVHTRLSHDSPAPFEELVVAAPEAGLRWVAFAEHADAENEPAQIRGIIDGVLYIPGEELSRWGGAVLALGTERSLHGISKRMRPTVQAVRDAGGVPLYGHWTKYDINPGHITDGMAVYDLTEDVRDLSIFDAFPIFLNLSSGDHERAEEAYLLWLLRRPDAHLAAWDRYLAEGPFAGVAETNAHAKFRYLGRTFDPYVGVIGLVRNHALLRGVDEASVLDALGRGRLHVGFDAAADSTGFRFEAWQEERPVAAMGDSVTWHAALRLVVHLPLCSEVRLLKDGKVVRSATGRVHLFAPDGPGVYRVEANLDVDGRDLPWVLSNPIRVLDSETRSP
jgi:hypothetical protein